jgi:hypothetical protein
MNKDSKVLIVGMGSETSLSATREMLERQLEVVAVENKKTNLLYHNTYLNDTLPVITKNQSGFQNPNSRRERRKKNRLTNKRK